MLYQFLKISFRNITRHKFFSAINIFGLMLSITICIPAMMIIKHQLEFDDFHPHPDETFRVITQVNYNTGEFERFATTPVILTESLKEYEFVEAVVPLYRDIFRKASTENKELDISGSFTTPDFFDVFGFEFKYGNKDQVLNEPYSIVLTDYNARRFFDDENPVGEVLSIKGVGDFTVTGVLKELPSNTHLRIGALASINTLPLLENESQMKKAADSWSNYGRNYTYLLTKGGTSKEAVGEAAKSISSIKTTGLELGENIENYHFDVQTLAEISPGEYLRRDIGAGKTRPLENLLVLMGIALVILLMACFNYTNLSIARALKRAKEVGVYKVLGARRWQVISQFVIQSTLMATAALILAYGLLPWIPLPPTYMAEVQTITPDLELILWFLGFVIFTGLLAGFLPAWLITSLDPVQALKNIKSFKLMKGLNFRKGLVVIQFTLSVVLLIVTTAIYQQSQYVASADYGFQRESMIDIQLQDVDHQLLEDELSQVAGVQNISAISERFGRFVNGRLNISMEKGAEPLRVQYVSVDQNVIPNMDIDLLAGSNFPEEISSEQESHIIVNESFVSLFSWGNPLDAVGKQVWLEDSTQVVIAGVIEDFNYDSMSMPIRAMALRYKPDQFRFLNIKYSAASAEDIKQDIEAAWAEIAPKIPIRYTFTDEALYEAYAHKQDVAAFSFYALIALVIASLGLLGMVTYTVEVRTQEVGVRKILGASVPKIIGLLSREFVILLGIAGLIGLPVGYWLGWEFITSYTYHINIGFGTLTLGLLILLVVGIFAVGTQTWKIASSNPIEALRSE